MTTPKTKTKLVDVARMLFAKNGLENTTMNDIALASGKGRRTLYTYFKSKEEIYWAVIECELERLIERMNDVASQDTEPEDKLVELVYTHLKMIKEAVQRNGNLRAEFFRNVIMVEKVRKDYETFAQRESALAEQLTAEQNRAKDLEERIGKMDLEQAPEFKKKYDVPITAVKDEIAKI